MPINKIEWEPLIQTPISLEVQTKVINTKGRLVYEYNPFRNLRLSENKYLYEGNYYTTKEFFDLGYLIVKYKIEENYKTETELKEAKFEKTGISHTTSDGIKYFEWEKDEINEDGSLNKITINECRIEYVNETIKTLIYHLRIKFFLL